MQARKFQEGSRDRLGVIQRKIRALEAEHSELARGIPDPDLATICNAIVAVFEGLDRSIKSWFHEVPTEAGSRFQSSSVRI